MYFNVEIHRKQRPRCLNRRLRDQAPRGHDASTPPTTVALLVSPQGRSPVLLTRATKAAGTTLTPPPTPPRLQSSPQRGRGAHRGRGTCRSRSRNCIALPWDVIGRRRDSSESYSRPLTGNQRVSRSCSIVRSKRDQHLIRMDARYCNAPSIGATGSRPDPEHITIRAVERDGLYARLIGTREDSTHPPISINEFDTGGSGGVQRPIPIEHPASHLIVTHRRREDPSHAGLERHSQMPTPSRGQTADVIWRRNSPDGVTGPTSWTAPPSPSTTQITSKWSSTRTGTGSASRPGRLISMTSSAALPRNPPSQWEKSPPFSVQFSLCTGITLRTRHAPYAQPGDAFDCEHVA